MSFHQECWLGESLPQLRLQLRRLQWSNRKVFSPCLFAPSIGLDIRDHIWSNPDSKVHGDNMGPIWGRQDPGGPHVGPMNFAIWVANIMTSWHACCITGPLWGESILSHGEATQRAKTLGLTPIRLRSDTFAFDRYLAHVDLGPDSI